MARIQRINQIPKLDMRLKIFKKYYDRIERMQRRIDLNVTKKYFMSKKNIYGIDNELNLVEHIQKALIAIFKHDLTKGTVLNHDSLKKITKEIGFKTPKGIKGDADTDP